MRVCSVCSRCYEDSVPTCTEEGHSILSETRDGSPQMITGYRLEELLASGPNTETYRARETASGTSCVVRIISAEQSNSQRFLDEARIAAGLFHPHVADVYEAGMLGNGDVFAVAEDGRCETLRDRLDMNGVPELLTSIQIMRQASEGLHALHQKGLTHRAVKPENLLLSSDTQGRLAVRVQHPDFGGVAHLSTVSNKFLIESQLASLRYFAPEQFEGEAVGPQTDVYSLGIVFYEILSGRPPFDASKAAGLIEMHRDQQPPDVRIDDFNLRMLVTHALTESLQKPRSRRQSSADLFARQLRHIEQLSTHVSTPPPAGVAPPEPPRVAPRLSVALDPDLSATTRPFVVAVPAKSSCAEPAEELAKTLDIDVDEQFDAVIETDQGIAADGFTDLPVPHVPVVQEMATHVPGSRRSRMKLHRKRLRSTIVPRKEISQNVPPVLPDVEKGPLPDDARITPTMIEWDQPEDDIPSIENVLEVLSNENAIDLPLLPTNDAEIREPVPLAETRWPIPRVVEKGNPPVAARTARTMIEWEQPEDDIPSMADVLEVLSSENPTGLPLLPTDNTEIPQPVVSAEARDVIPRVVWLGEDASPAPVNKWPLQEQFDDQVVTTIELNRRIGKLPDRRPVLLRDKAAIETVRANTGALMLGGYSTPAEGGVASRRRSLFIGTGLAVLTALALFGTGSLTRYLPGETEIDHVSANPAPASSTDRSPVIPASASPRKARKASTEVPRPVDKTKEKPAKTVPAADSAKKPMPPSNERRVASKARPEKKPTQKNKIALLTRPRVVRNY